MRTISFVSAPRSSFAFNRIAGAVVLAGLIAAGAGCSGSPTEPGAFLSERRVETGSGGGSTSPVCSTADICGRVAVTAAGGSLSGTSTVEITSPRVFAFTAPLSGSGRFTSGFISAEVSGDTAVIHEITYQRGNGAFGETSVSVPALTTIREGGCADGRTLVQTRITAPIQNLGPTTIVESHCYLASV
jgi:hypothetical protein